MTEQLGLRYDSKYISDEHWGRVLVAFRDVVSSAGLKAAAFELDVQPSVLAHAMAERERHYVRGEWLVWAMARPCKEARELAAALVAPAGLEVAQRRELSPMERLTRIMGALDRNPTLARAIYEDAFGDAP